MVVKVEPGTQGPAGTNSSSFLLHHLLNTYSAMLGSRVSGYSMDKTGMVFVLREVTLSGGRENNQVILLPQIRCYHRVKAGEHGWEGMGAT